MACEFFQDRDISIKKELCQIKKSKSKSKSKLKLISFLILQSTHHRDPGKI
jgi:hypothetical protein